jgi:hypothetical protein
VRRLRALAALAARRRDAPLLLTLDRALRFAASGHTAGEALLTARLAASQDELLRRIGRLPAPSPSFEVLPPVVTGVILVRGVLP